MILFSALLMNFWLFSWKKICLKGWEKMVFFASFSNFLDPQLNFVKKYIIKWAMVFFNLPWWTLKNFVKKAGYNDVGTKNVARCRGLNFRFQRRFVYKKKVKKKTKYVCCNVCLFVCFVGQWVATLGIIIRADRAWKTTQFCRKNSGGGRELYSERLGKDF